MVWVKNNRGEFHNLSKALYVAAANHNNPPQSGTIYAVLSASELEKIYQYTSHEERDAALAQIEMLLGAVSLREV